MVFWGDFVVNLKSVYISNVKHFNIISFLVGYNFSTYKVVIMWTSGALQEHAEAQYDGLQDRLNSDDG